MKSFYVIALMGAAAVGGGLIVRYNDHPVEITLGRPLPPKVVAPPIAPAAKITSVSTAPRQQETSQEPPTRARFVPDQQPSKPSALSEPARRTRSEPAHAPRPERTPAEPRYTARVTIPPDPPAIIPLESSSVPPRAAEPAATLPPTVAEKPAPTPSASQAPSAPEHSSPEPNRATLRSGMLITVRIHDAMSSNLNSRGDVFSGTLDKPLIADGFVIAERGARVRGEVVDARSAGPSSELAIRLREILSSDGQRVRIVSDPWRKSGSVDSTPSGSTNPYDQPLTRDGAAVIRPGTTVSFRLEENVQLTERR